MKIVFIGGRDIRRIGGIENYMFNLATELVKLGHECIVYCESDRNGSEIINGFKVIYKKSFGGRFLCKPILGLFSTLDALFKQKKVDIIHYNAAGPALFSFITLFSKTKVLVQGHGLEFKRTKYSKFQSKILKTLESFVVFTHKNLIMVSNEQSDYYNKKYNKKCITIPTAVNLPITNINSDILKKNNLEKEGYFLYLGRLVQDKNPDFLIKAFIESEIENMKLVIAGNNDSDIKYVNYLHSLAKNNQNIIFTGAVYGDDKEMLLKECFAFCIPSTLEGLPITLLEAMSYGKLCIASEIPANKEALGESGIWVKYEDVDDLKNKLLYTIKNYEAIRYQKEYNLNRVRKYFTWEDISKQYDDYIKYQIK